MKLKVIEQQLQSQIEKHLKDVSPGLMLRVYQAGRLVIDIGVGKTWAHYDFASLTKTIFTVQTLMHDFEKQRWTFDTPVKHFLSWFPHEQITIAQCLTHSTGLPWWRPFYKDIHSEQGDVLLQLQTVIKNLPLENPEQCVYSDMGFLVLLFVLQEMHQKPLYEIWRETKATFYEGTTLDFHPQHQMIFKKENYAPTQECPWRGQLIQGVVHDENTYALGGVSTHAGLFGSIDDLGVYMHTLRSQILGIGRSPIKIKTAKKFIQRARPEGQGDWAMGFMLPTPGQASCGSYFDLTSIGHTGFTGTSFWYDIKQDLMVGLLSNRVLYGRENTGFKNLRPLIHNWVVESLRKAAF